MSETKPMAGRFQQLAQDDRNCVLEGFHAVKHATRFNAEILKAVCVNKKEVLALARELAPDILGQLDETVEEWPQTEWRSLGVEIPTGIAAVARKKDYQLTQILEHANYIVLLEEPRNLGNVGAVIRVAAAADAGGVIMSGTVDPWSRSVIRGAAGLQYAVPVVCVSGALETDRPIYAFDPEGANLEDVQVPRSAILAFGTERGGLSGALLKRATQRVAIPMREKVSSMNLATSVAVALYMSNFNRRS
jgi:RNA methyltransferase, TrmH family